MALSQLSRNVESRPGSKKPVLSDLRESGAIEQDADMVLFIYRPEYYGLTEDENGASAKGKAVISIAKHRNGKLGDITLKFVGQYAKFEDIVETYGDPNGSGNGSGNMLPNNNFEQQFTTKVVSSRMNDDFIGA